MPMESTEATVTARYPIDPRELPSQYAMTTFVSSGKDEIVLDFAQVANQTLRKEKDSDAKANIDAVVFQRIIISPAHATALISVLKQIMESRREA